MSWRNERKRSRILRFKRCFSSHNRRFISVRCNRHNTTLYQVAMPVTMTQEQGLLIKGIIFGACYKTRSESDNSYPHL
jgi:hypothetical protein